MSLRPSDEGRHHPPPGGAPWWEWWQFDAWRPDGSLAVTCRLTFVPSSRRAWYWCQLVRRDEALLHVADLDAPLPAAGLTLRAEGLWAEHVCEAAFEQWTIANETYAVSLDDPEEALGRAYGRPAPLALDIEWYASAGPDTVTDGYRQRGEVHGEIELEHGPIELEGPGTREHRWGPRIWSARPDPWPAGLAAPVRLLDGRVLDQVATSQGWLRGLRP